MVTLLSSKASFLIDDVSIECVPFIGYLPSSPYDVPPQLRHVSAECRLFDSVVDVIRADSLEGLVIVVREPVRKNFLVLLDLIAEVSRRGAVGLVMASGYEDYIDLSPVDVPNLRLIQTLKLFKHIPVVAITGPAMMTLVSKLAPTSLAHLAWRVEYGISSAVNLRVNIKAPQNAAVPPVLVTAHFDSAFEKPECVGANDNAVGVVSVLELARCFSQLVANGRINPQHDTEFVFYDAEEYGAAGCWSVCNDMTKLPRDSVKELCAAYEALENYVMDVMHGRDPDKVRSLRVLNTLSRPTTPSTVFEIDTIGAGDTLVIAENTVNHQPQISSEKWFLDLSASLFPKHKLRVQNYKGNVATFGSVFGGQIKSILIQQTGIRQPYHTVRDNIDSVDFDALYKMITLYLGVLTRL